MRRSESSQRVLKQKISLVRSTPPRVTGEYIIFIMQGLRGKETRGEQMIRVKYWTETYVLIAVFDKSEAAWFPFTRTSFMKQKVQLCNLAKL